ncbi:MAG: nuclear transport factor 2 family protein [Acidobacteriota bacterium]
MDTTTTELAHAFAQLCSQGKLEEARQFWSDDIVSIESFPGPRQVCRGREAVLEKQKMWSEGTEMHGVTCEGPFIHGDQFALRFSLDCTDREGRRSTMHEVALYTVEGGAVSEERFFPLAAG